MIQQRSSSSLFCRRPLWAVLAWARMSTLWGCPSSISSADHSVTHPPRWPEGWFGEAVVACEMPVPEPCKFPSSDNCQKRFLWTHKEVILLLTRCHWLIPCKIWGLPWRACWFFFKMQPYGIEWISASVTWMKGSNSVLQWCSANPLDPGNYNGSSRLMIPPHHELRQGRRGRTAQG